MTNIKILLVDDTALFVETLRDRLQRERSFHVVGVAGTAEDAVAQALKHKPDIVIMDVDMRGHVCFDAAREIRSALPEARLMFLSAVVQDYQVDQALEIGGLAYLTKDETPDRLAEAISEVAKNKTQFSDQVQARLVHDDSGLRLDEERQSQILKLTKREVEVLWHIANGLAKKDIAARMGVGTKTVEKHTENIMRKVGIHDRVQLARYAIREGLAEP